MDHAIVYPIVALLCGIAILIWPRILNYIVAAYLIITGAVGLIAYLSAT